MRLQASKPASRQTYKMEAFSLMYVVLHCTQALTSITMTMITDPQKIALDLVWDAQHELWQPAPDYRKARDIGLKALYKLEHPRHRANACLILAKAHEGLRNWFIAVVYWKDCRDLYPAGFNKDMQSRLDICREYRDEQERHLNRSIRGKSNRS